MGGLQWLQVSTMLSLGQCLTSSGTQAEDRKRLKRSWETAFWRNGRVLANKRLSVLDRLRFWGLLSKCMGSFDFLCGRLSRLQRV